MEFSDVASRLEVLLLGDKDSNCIQQISKILGENLPNAKTILIKNTDHLLNFEKPDELNAADEFLHGIRYRQPPSYYLVRNSWGKDCNQYYKGWPCDQGDIWVKAEDLTRSTWSLSVPFNQL